MDFGGENLMAEGFYFNNVDDLMPFWRAVRMFKIDTEEGRVKLLRKFVARKQAKYLPHPETYLEGKRIKRLT